MSQKRSRPIAIDLTLIPYYGKPKTDKRELRGGEAKQGATQFHAYATAYMVSHGERFTLAMAYVLRDEPLKDVVQRLVQQVRKIGIRIRYLLLDREFFSRPVVCYLTSAHCPFLMPVARRGRRPKDPARSPGSGSSSPGRKVDGQRMPWNPTAAACGEATPRKRG